ncbi:MAG: thioester reductase domain-containing protein [Nostoc sp. NMS7]|uniref:thioester reductase domain-containing protein n=1 Tax=Nostoc sp. NMS7 TaxID=2815391 RepID=UPI0025FB2B35|nr:thioester reductase domain-containing protein [Nostoc sp. NMS7]MBN3950377.1 thioester reductase domain-containing protein [Nostoc sp. NMS7]
MINSDTLDRFNGTEIAIIGMSGRFPKARSIDEFWHNLRDGVESISFLSNQELESSGVDAAVLNSPNYVKATPVMEGIDMFDASFFGFNPREAEIMDPQHRLFLECACEAVENAGYNSESYQGQIGVYAGVSISTYLFNIFSNLGLVGAVGDLAILHGNEKDYLTTRVSYKLNLKGPSVAVQTSCSTSLVAVHLSCQSLLNHECDMALAGGVSISVPQKVGYLYQEGGIFSPDGRCRAFDAKAQGTIFGSGVGIVVLKRLADALANGDHIHAVIKGSAINNDGSLKVGYTAPSVDGQAEVIAEAMAIARVEPETITYIEAHGTATPVGDPIEVAALTQVFRTSTQKKGFCAIGSVKTNVGHLNTASGVTGLIKTVLALKNKLIPPSLHFEQPNPKIDFANSPFYVNTELTEWKTDRTPRRAGVSSFGIGGTNAHIILEEAPLVQASGISRPWQLLVLSAKTNSALETATDNLVDYLKQHPDVNLADVTHTYHIGKKAFSHRRMLVCRDLDDAALSLEMLNPKRVFTATQEPSERSVVFMFTGQGAQYVNMALELYQEEPIFREQVDLCSEFLKPKLGLDLRQVLYPRNEQAEEATQQLQQTFITQPALFVIEYALAKLWMSWGVHPQAMIGHSIGEYVAASLAGVFSLEDALKLVTARGQLMQNLPGGAMLAVSLPEKEVYPLLGQQLSLAANNGLSLCVVSGPTEAVDALQMQLLERGIECRLLHTSHAFHSVMMDSMLVPFTDLVEKVHLKPPTIPYISNVTGTWIKATEATNPSYWAKHLRQTVRLADGMHELLTEPERILLEVGPGRTLSTLARCHPNKTAGHIILSSLRHPHDQFSDVAFLLNTLGQIWLVGVKVDWSGFYAHERRHRLPLPTYPFERQRYWIEPQQQIYQASINQQTQLKSLKDTENAEKVNSSSLHPRPYLPNVYVAPTNELERTIANIWQNLLGIEQVGIHDNFFELGGHSMLATQLVLQLRETFQVELSLRSLLETPTVADFAQVIDIARREGSFSENRATTDTDLQAEAVLDPAINPEALPVEYIAEPANIFLTGVTGFLGAFLLHELLEQTPANIYCLVRAHDAEEGKNRIQKNLETYSLWNEFFKSRIIPILGDLSKSLLGLSNEQFYQMSTKIDVIYHNGALVNFIYPYHALKATNVLGTQEILRLACQFKVKPVHYISSIAVFDLDAYSDVKLLEEEDNLEHSEGYYTGYGQGKWVAEKLVKIAQSRGVPVCIYRPGNIVGDSKTGICHTNDMLFRMAKGCIQLGIASNNDTLVDMTPVDYVSKALIYLSRQKESLGKVFHLVNPHPIHWSNIINWINSFGYPLQSVAYDKWRAELINVARHSQENALYPLLALFSEEQNQPTRLRKYDCQNTLIRLANTSIICPPVDTELLSIYFSYFIRSGFLNSPQPVTTSR